jgi:SAM-dependent methyltransferase
MLEQNEAEVMARIKPGDVVLDIGGWARPFNRADFVLDAEPYETRGSYGPTRPAQGGTREYFTRETWHIWDICSHEPFPFPDKKFDFVICSQTLEDIRDPIWVCREMSRIGKSGYIETPSRKAEQSRGLEPGIVGWSHHRWLIDMDQERQHVRFVMKFHLVHGDPRLSFPPAMFDELGEAARNQWIFWTGHLTADEEVLHGPAQYNELAGYVERHRPMSGTAKAAASVRMKARETWRKYTGKIRRRIYMPLRSRFG